ncbi:MAG: glycine cleavage T C-terminal barrel domain-containing protein [Verrucomicrobiia bacterium]
MPPSYDLYWQCLKHGAVWPLTSHVILKITGFDAFRYLNGQITNDLKKLTVDHSLYSAVVTPKGKLVANIYLATPDNKDFYLNGPGALKEILPARLEKYLIADDALIENVSDKFYLIHAWGQEAEKLPPPFLKSQNNRLGFEGFDFYYESMPDLALLLTCDEDSAETFRIEAGLPKWGAELHENTLPPEVGFEERWISYQKGCYTGQEVIARLKSVGHVNRKLMGIYRVDNQLLAPQQTIQHNGRTIGHITSSMDSPRLEKGIALGYVDWQSAHHGHQATVETHEVILVNLPFI